MKKAKGTLLVTLLTVLLGSGVFVGFFMPPDDDFFALRKNFHVLRAIYEELVTGYVDDLDAEALLRSGIDAMLADLDPYTAFIDEADNADIEIITRGRYGGVGLNLGMRGGKITVISPVEGASGYKQGIRAGDILTHIAGKSTEGLSLSDIRNLMRGEPGTAVEITIVREGLDEPLNFLLTREEVRLKNVTYSGFIEDDTLLGIGYIRLDRFARDADSEVQRAIKALDETGRLQSLILDLRDNPGGLLDAAVRITQLFVPQGSTIVSTRGRSPETERTYRSQTAPLLPDLPLVVLVNEYSASASEIVAGAIQDLDRGVIVGTTSYGKGLVQVIKPLPYNTSLKMTTSRYYTPSGRSIQAIDYGRHDGTSSEIPDSLRRVFRTAHGRAVLDGNGIEPDIEVSPGEVSELEQALDRRAAIFFFANHYAATHPTIPPSFTVTDEVMEEFKTWLEDQGFTYRTDAERSIDDIARALEELGYESATDEVKALRAAVAKEKAEDFDRHDERIRERLRAEILARYSGEEAQIKAALARDAQVKAAVSLLQDNTAYAAVLR